MPEHSIEHTTRRSSLQLRTCKKQIASLAYLEDGKVSTLDRKYVLGVASSNLVMASEEEDDYARENEAGERLVGRGLRGRVVNPQDPQWYLANSGQPINSRIICLFKDWVPPMSLTR